jgi:hypothetical protein
MGVYTSVISSSGKAITIWGQGKVLDASGGGRFFRGVGTGSFLELHDAVLQNGYAENVSGRSASHHAVLSTFPDFSAPIPGGGHATCRAELFMLIMGMWRSTTAPFL